MARVLPVPPGPCDDHETLMECDCTGGCGRRLRACAHNFFIDAERLVPRWRECRSCRQVRVNVGKQIARQSRKAAPT